MESHPDIRKIIFHVNNDKPDADAVRARLAAFAASVGLEVVQDLDSADEPNDLAVIVLGGDGTMLSAVHRFPGVPL